ncbi:putative ABC bile acid transporter [Tothia fuscella]|uniref:ABC bile acid transporter n=1 Tax=Tothia fuscella TaxID=1048955 RepID=A0A9P4NIB0_9PEZI|nr:putative ABC bile acid transporter [Tothia fuscella]
MDGTQDSALSFDLIIATAGFGLALCFTIPTAKTLYLTLFKSNNTTYPSDFYKDDDGEAEDHRHSSLYPARRRCALAAAVIVGLNADLFTLALIIRGTMKTNATVLSLLFELGMRILALVQMVDIIIDKCTVTTFQKALATAATSNTLAIVIWTNHSDALFNPRLIEFASILSSFLAAFFSAFFCSSMPRRPDVYYRGKLVERQYTVSLLQRLTFSWISPLFKLTKAQHGLHLTDLPILDHSNRAENLASLYNRDHHSQALLHFLLRESTWPFVNQNLLTILQSICIVVPQIALFFLLKSLEAPNSEGTYSTGRCVLLLGISMLVQSFLSTWAQWISFSRLKIPIQVQLSSLIFQKSLHRKDVKSVNDDRESVGSPSKDESRVPSDGHNNKAEDGIMNLVGVDAKRVSDFAAYNNLLIGSVCRLLFSFGFLILMLGWLPVFAGLVIQATTTPINVYTSKKYALVQATLMSARDRKMKIIAETLSNLRQIKFSAMEALWEERINESRLVELSVLRRVFTINTILICTWLMGPILLSAISIGVYVLLGRSLTPSIAFTTISVFSGVESSLTVLPEIITAMLDALISLTRVQDYLNSSDNFQTTIPGDHIKFRDAKISWPTDNSCSRNAYTLDVDKVDFPTGELSIISGPTSSGKSLLLAAIIGEGEVLSGTCTWLKMDFACTQGICGKQEPWIENATIRDNIVFGLPFFESRYNQTIEACALVKDIEMSRDRDLTEIGHNGVNLSGGQKWRLSLARALYSRAGILVLDDIFSAVDANVGRHILEHAINGPLADGRTRILATHHVDLCIAMARYHVKLEQGAVQQAYEIQSIQHGSVALKGLDAEQPHMLSICGPVTGSEPGLHSQLKSRAFVQEELKRFGAVKLAVYWNYVSAAKGCLAWTLIISLFGLFEILLVSRRWWVVQWTSEVLEVSGDSDRGVQTVAANNILFYLGVYVLLSLILCIVGTLRYRFLYFASLRASQELYQRMIYSIIRAPKRWVDTVPLGRILNRFSTDFVIVDSQLCNDLAYALYSLLIVVGISASAAIISPLVIPFTLILLALCLYYASRYLNVARDMRRLEAISRSHIFETCSSIASGIGTIRAFQREKAYIDKAFEKIDANARTIWYTWCFNAWFSLRLGVLGTLFSIATAWLIVSLRVEPALAGFALSFTLQYTESVVQMLKRYTDAELGMNAMERITEYSEMEVEDDSGDVVPASWPSTGSMEIKNLAASYAPDLPPVLKGITCSINGGERIGIVGRTGAGKSSLAQAIFRFLEAQEGSIHIDGIDISTVKLYDLRRRLAIIPQDPVLFNGTIRSNLDPFDEYGDLELQTALELICLGPPEQTKEMTQAAKMSHQTQTLTLDSSVSASGANLSQGQRQLLSLARAILIRPKLLILDEATSAVDKATDNLIQQSIRANFAHSTILVIAHRLSTVIDFDKIMVIRDGACVEFGRPEELMGIRDGEFKRIVECSAGRSAIVDGFQ